MIRYNIQYIPFQINNYSLNRTEVSMTTIVITQDIKDALLRFLDENRPAELINTYLHFIENKFKLQPVLFPRDKIIFQSADDAAQHLEKDQKLWREAEIKIGF